MPAEVVLPAPWRPTMRIFRWRAGGEVGGALAEEIDELVVDDFDDLLAGADALEDLLAQAFFFDAGDEFAGDFEVDIGAEEGGAHFLESDGHIVLGELADATEVA